ncbi:MAG: DUF1127 domain-containing protein [Betaproteobacteria bacterium]|jgi:uncharacterized protein YjiS (DUF1127 family)|nr:DUF1127 domain-containing protein [Betaproteobacteria bacterium]
MNACTTTAPVTNAAGRQPARGIARAWARSLGDWLAFRARSVRDRAALAEMSERELRDIGVDRGLLDYAASGAWHRDVPH